MLTTKADDPLCRAAARSFQAGGPAIGHATEQP